MIHVRINNDDSDKQYLITFEDVGDIDFLADYIADYPLYLLALGRLNFKE